MGSTQIAVNEPTPTAAASLGTADASESPEAELRGRFLADPAGADLSDLRPVIAGSWQRSLAWNASLDPVSEARDPEIDQRVIDSAEPAIRMLLRATREQESCVVLADRFGTVATVRGSRTSLRWARGFARPGTSLAEDVAGTNCVGTAIEEQRGVTVAGREHLAPRFDDCWTASSLVRDPLRRSVRAVLALVLPRADSGDLNPDGLSALVDRAAAEVADVLAAKLAAREQSLLTAYLRHVRKRGSGAVMAIDGRTTIANHGALDLLGPREQLVLAAYAQEAQRARHDMKRELTLDDGSSLAVDIHPVLWGDEPVGSVLDLRGAAGLGKDAATPSASERIDPFAALIGQSPAFTRAMELAHRVIERGESAHIIGETGTGKRTLALAMAQAHGASGVPFDGESLEGNELARVGPMLEQDRVVVIHRADLMQGGGWRDLTRLAAGRPDARFVLTGRSLPSAALEFVRAIGSLEIEMPALRARRDDVPSLVSTFVGTVAEGSGRVSSRLLKALMEAELPGNVAQLREIVTTAATRCSTSELTTEDLTAEHREALMRNSLSPLQIAEAMQIREALREAEGNRVRAAEILRIGRSTLYRRLDMYTRLGFEL
jgi:transcriptional regulator of acetoin/glycerol metabolism